MAIPSNSKSLRGFLGLTGYDKRFVANYGQIAAPLTKLTKKDSFRWTEEATEAFERLKHAMTTVLVLTLPNFELPFILETDASDFGIGAFFMLEQRPLAYFSQILSNRA